MKFLNILFTIVLLCLICTTTFGEEESPKRNNLLLRRPGGRAGPLSKSTTTTAAPKVEEEFGDEEYDQSEDLDEVEKEQEDTAAVTTTTTSTEPPKKIGPIIRPFRSNDDLLLALKRRQMNVKKGVTKVAVEKPVAKLESEGSENDEQEALAPAGKSSVDRASRRRFGREGGKPGDADDTSAPAEEQPAKKPSRFALRPSRSN